MLIDGGQFQNGSVGPGSRADDGQVANVIYYSYIKLIITGGQQLRRGMKLHFYFPPPCVTISRGPFRHIRDPSLPRRNTGEIHENLLERIDTHHVHNSLILSYTAMLRFQQVFKKEPGYGSLMGEMARGKLRDRRESFIPLAS